MARMSTACLVGGIFSHHAPSHPCPFLSDQPFEGPDGQEHSGGGGWPHHQLQGPLLAPGPPWPTQLDGIHVLCEGAQLGQPHSIALWWSGLKIWLHHYAAVSWVLMTLSVNHTSCCPGLVDTNSFPSRDLVLGAIAALKTSERNSKWENPSRQQRKEFAGK